MSPINAATGQKWSTANSARMQQEIRSIAQAALTARDRSRGIPEGGQVYSGADGRFIVDRHLAGLKHTGRELRLLTMKHWAAFCRTPKDETAYMAVLVEADNKAARKRMATQTAAAPDVEMTIPSPGKLKSAAVK